MIPILLLLVWALVMILSKGPRIPMNTGLRPLWLPEDDLDCYLAERERRIPDIIPHTAKKIVWAGHPGQPTDYAIIYLHGFSATRQETAPLADLLAKKWHANLFYTRLTGHGRFDPNALLTGSVQAWVNDAHEAWAIGRRLGRKVIVVGYSTGGTLAAWLAAQKNHTDMAALVLLAPNFGLANPLGGILAWPWGGVWGQCLLGRTYHTDYTTPDQARYWTASYPTRALLPMMGIMRLVKSVDKQAIACPTLIVHSTRDKIVSSRATAQFYAQLGAVQKQLIHFDDTADPNGHVMAGNLVSPHSTPKLAHEIDAALNRWLAG